MLKNIKKNVTSVVIITLLSDSYDNYDNHDFHEWENKHPYILQFIKSLFRTFEFFSLNFEFYLAFQLP